MKKSINLIRDYHDCHLEHQLDCDCKFIDIHNNVYENIKKEVIDDYKKELTKFINDKINYLNNNVYAQDIRNMELKEGMLFAYDYILVKIGEFDYE
ncbi:MAG: hypothetical protein PPFGHCPK_01097 [Spiroplasma endosymbiont of Drosophila atripex]|nr:MAG: hypothetical protein PPFGHCPK_01097 [Spiroplasma endosymbiont of Drosophila atripex]